MTDSDFDTAPTNGSRRDTASLRLPLSLLGCFPNDPEWAWGMLTDREDWNILDLDLPDEAFAAGRTGEGASSRPSSGSRLREPTATQGKSPRPPEAVVSSRATALPVPGSVIDKYRVEELIGTGGFAAVYKATHLLLRVPVALKLLRPEVVERDPRLADLLCEEGRFAALISHPNVVRVFDVTRSARLTYIVMEFIDGASLHDTVRRQGPLPAAEVLRIGIDVCQGLRAALAQGLIHRDIKPANILLPRTGGARIVDMGLVHRVDNDGQASALGSIVGTPSYMAPEQAADPERVDFRSDVYALGATLYHAAVGVPPFRSKNVLELVELHRTAAVERPSTVRPDVPNELSRVLLWMLEKDPARRAGSYDALLAALEEALDAIHFHDRLEGLVGPEGGAR